MPPLVLYTVISIAVERFISSSFAVRDVIHTKDCSGQGGTYGHLNQGQARRKLGNDMYRESCRRGLGIQRYQPSQNVAQLVHS